VTDDPTIALYLDDATDTLSALELIIDWLEHADPDTLDDLTAFCGQRHRVTDVEATIVRQAHTIRRALPVASRQILRER
jgi:hypothetical protein